MYTFVDAGFWLRSCEAVFEGKGRILRRFYLGILWRELIFVLSHKVVGVDGFVYVLDDIFLFSKELLLFEPVAEEVGNVRTELFEIDYL